MRIGSVVFGIALSVIAALGAPHLPDNVVKEIMTRTEPTEFIRMAALSRRHREIARSHRLDWLEQYHQDPSVAFWRAVFNSRADLVEQMLREWTLDKETLEFAASLAWDLGHVADEVKLLLLRHGAHMPPQRNNLRLFSEWPVLESMVECAVVRQQHGALGRLLASGANPNLPGGLPILRAVRLNDTVALRALIDAGVNVNDERREPPLLFAVDGNLMQIAVMLIDAGADVNGWHGFGLEVAVGRGLLDMTQYLIERGADPHANTLLPQGGLLALAARRDGVEMVELLLRNGVSPRQFDHTALFQAVYNKNADIVQTLLNHGAYADAVRDNLAIPECLGAFTVYRPLSFSVCCSPNLAIINALIDAGVDYAAVTCAEAYPAGHPVRQRVLGSAGNQSWSWASLSQYLFGRLRDE